MIRYHVRYHHLVPADWLRWVSSFANGARGLIYGRRLVLSYRQFQVVMLRGSVSAGIKMVSRLIQHLVVIVIASSLSTVPVCGQATMSGVNIDSTNTTLSAPLGTSTTKLGSTAFTANDFVARGSVSPMDYGCAGNGTTVDTTCFQNALTAAAGRYLDLGDHLYKISAVSSSSPVYVRGPHGGQGIYSSTCTSGLIAATTNLTLLTLPGGSVIDGLCIQMGSGNTSGVAIFMGTGSQGKVRDTQINTPYVGIDVTGNGTEQNVATVLDGNVVFDPMFAAFRIGVNSSGGNTVDTRVINNGVVGAPGNSATGLLLLDDGGSFTANNDIFQLNIGTKTFPSSGQVVNGFFSGILGDTSYTYDAVIDENGGVVNFFLADKSWVSSNLGQSFLIQQTGSGGGVSNITLHNQPIFLHGGSGSQIGLDIEGGEHIQVMGAIVCAETNAPNGVGIKLAAAASYVDFTGVKFGNCGGTLNAGYSIATGATDFTMTGGDFGNAVTTPISWTPSSNGADIATIGQNLGIDSATPTVASATTIAAPINGTVFISGTVSIQNITGGWSNRQMTLIALGGFNLVTGGAMNTKIATRAAVPQYGSITLTYSQGLKAWTHQ